MTNKQYTVQLAVWYQIIVLTWLNTAEFIIVVWHIDAATIQTWPLFNTQKQFLYQIHCDTNHVATATIQVVVLNQVNMVYIR